METRGIKINILAYISALTKGIIYGLTPFFTGVLAENMDVLDLLSLRFLLSLAVMWVLKSLGVLKISASPSLLPEWWASAQFLLSLTDES